VKRYIERNILSVLITIKDIIKGTAEAIEKSIASESVIVFIIKKNGMIKATPAAIPNTKEAIFIIFIKHRMMIAMLVNKITYDKYIRLFIVCVTLSNSFPKFG